MSSSNGHVAADDILEQILNKLPNTSSNGKPPEIKVMTVRLPVSLHAALKQEARDRNTSANRLAVAKLAIKAKILDKVAEAMGEDDGPA